MKTRLIIDGNAFYEVDEECLLRRKQEEERVEKENTQKEKADKNRKH